ncbi:hypothetical protein CRG98_044125 [Punica granatum]|uniref:DDE Tnp4 domain-containing protein n=1 Tax=Punica granatum TaxID=22663 RepID=A0A2I0HUX0_PUNGR|nr:hypothetical protein CRG98_044125 [Punica granatum]
MKTQYTQFTELIQHTGVGWDGPTNTVKANPDIWDKFIKEFLALRNSRGKEPIDLAEGFGDSDDPTDEAEEPVVTGSRRRVRKRGSNNKSQLQELIDLYKESKHCIGAIDGTHVKAIMPASVRGAYRDRNGDITQNVLAVCSHQMIFTYIMTGWEGSAHDSRILSDAVSLPKFPAPQGVGRIELEL